MPVSRSFLDYSLELLAGVGPIRARSMFGGYGVSLNGVNFGLVDDDRLYLATDDQVRGRFEAAGAVPFTFESKRKGTVVTSYLSLPEEAVDDPDQAVIWGRLSLEAALRKAAAKEKKPAKKAPPVTTKKKSAPRAPTKKKPAPRALTKRKPPLKGKAKPKARLRKVR